MPEPAPRTAPRLGIVGAGRLGGALAEAARRAGAPVVLTATATAGWQVRERPEVLLDASSPAALDRIAAYCAESAVPLLTCTSFRDPEHLKVLRRLAGTVAVLRATNLSVGHHLQARLVEHARTLPGARAAAVSVAERHPSRKAPQPSATALALARRWSEQVEDGAVEVRFDRGGPEVSDHEVTWEWPGGESVTIRHGVTSLAGPADAAVAAAARLRHAAPGLYPPDWIHDRDHDDDEEQEQP